jgi:CheY-like chemotaxis protein
MAEGLGSLKVLVIDDNPQMRSIVSTIVNGAGVKQLAVAANGRRGLDLVLDLRPDLIFVDYEMPIMDGLCFISAVRGLEDDLRFTPIIMVTGHGDLKRLSEARDRGVTEFVVKPVTAKAILDRLQHTILHPRPFVQALDYFGPERRRRRTEDNSSKRRLADRAPAA